MEGLVAPPIPLIVDPDSETMRLHPTEIPGRNVSFPVVSQTIISFEKVSLNVLAQYITNSSDTLEQERLKSFCIWKQCTISLFLCKHFFFLFQTMDINEKYKFF